MIFQHKSESQEWLSLNVQDRKRLAWANPKWKPCLPVVHKESVPIEQIVNQIFYRNVLEWFKKGSTEYVPKSQVMIGLSIMITCLASCQTAFSITQFLTSKGTTVLPQLPYLWEIFPCERYVLWVNWRY